MPVGLELINTVVHLSGVEINFDTPSATLATGLAAQGGDIVTTIKNSSIKMKAPQSWGVLVSGSADFTIEDSSISCTSTSGGSNPARVGAAGTKALFRNVRFETTSPASDNVIYVSDSTDVKIENSRLVSDSPNNNGVVSVDGAGFVTVSNSVIETGNTDPTLATFDTGTIRAASTQLSGGAVNNSGAAITCAGVWDENFTHSASTCP